MKGIVFTEFLEMVEESFGLETVDTILESSNLPSNGIYTSVGTYSFSEIVTLVSKLSSEVNLPIDDLIYAFGKYLFGSLCRIHPEVIQGYTNPIDLLNSIEDHIHVHVQKLYPDAELPTFNILSKTDHSITLIYESSRSLSSLAKGLMDAAFSHFNVKAKIETELLEENGTKVKFNIVQYNES